MKYNQIRRAVAAGVIAVAATVAITVTPASAAPVNPDGSGAVRQSITQGSLTGWHIQDGSVYCSDLGSGMCEWFTGGPYNNTVTSDTITNGSIRTEDLAEPLRSKATQPELGGLVEEMNLFPRSITRIGGKYQDNATDVAKFTLPAGKYQVTASGLFDREDLGSPGYLEPTTDTYPQFTLRYGEDFAASPVDWGVDAGTFGGVAISPSGFNELSFSTSKVITLTAPTQITARAFGYNEDRSAFGTADPANQKAPQFSVKSAQISAVKIG